MPPTTDRYRDLKNTIDYRLKHASLLPQYFGLSGAVAEKGDPCLPGIRTTGKGRYEENRGDMLSPALVGSLRFGYFAGAGEGKRKPVVADRKPLERL
jgi:hypothetical protein